MAIGKSGEKSVTMPKTTCQGPGGVASKANNADMSKGSLGMRQTYKQTGKPGNGKK